MGEKREGEETKCTGQKVTIIDQIGNKTERGW